MLIQMPPIKAEKTQSQEQATQTTAEENKKPPEGGGVTIPMSCFENYEKLDHPHLRDICESDCRIHSRCVMCNRRAGLFYGRPTDGAISCKTCRVTYYCSDECQADNQAHHSLICTQWARFAEPPSKTAGRMLIFPAKSTAPVLAWADLTQKSPGGEGSPRLRIPHPEAYTFANSIFTPSTTPNKLGRIGCINECRAIAASKHRLGHGLFVLEWTPPPTTNLAPDWINRSILSCTGLPPGQSWFWTGPVAIIALDIAHTRARARKFTLSHVGPRDVQHAIDFFALNLRNAAVPGPLSSSVPSPTPRWWRDRNNNNNNKIKNSSSSIADRSRFPFPTLPAVKLNELQTPVAKALQIKAALEEVRVSREVPPPVRGAAYQGVSAVCAALGLAWVVRVVLNHGAELDWLYDGLYPDQSVDGSSIPSVIVASGDGDGDGGGQGNGEKGGKGSIIPPWLDVVYALDDATEVVERKALLRSGDGVVLMHAGGGKLRKEHVQALLRFVGEGKIQDGCQSGGGTGEKEFKEFWRKFRIEENVAAGVPSPYELAPTLSALRYGHRFILCKEVFKRLIVSATPAMRMLADGTCVRR